MKMKRFILALCMALIFTAVGSAALADEIKSPPSVECAVSVEADQGLQPADFDTLVMVSHWAACQATIEAVEARKSIDADILALRRIIADLRCNSVDRSLVSRLANKMRNGKSRYRWCDPVSFYTSVNIIYNSPGVRKACED